MSININILFYLKKPKQYQDGPVPVYLRITVDGKRAELATGRVSEPDRWNPAAGRMRGTKESVKVLNAFLDTLQMKVYESQRQLIEANEQVSAEHIKNKLTGKQEKGRMLLEIFKEHNQKMAALAGTEVSAGTVKRYDTSLKHTKDFLLWKYGLPDIDICRIDPSFVSEYDFYLRSVRKCCNNSAVKYVKNFGKIIRTCLANGWRKIPFEVIRPGQSRLRGYFSLKLNWSGWGIRKW